MAWLRPEVAQGKPGLLEGRLAPTTPGRSGGTLPVTGKEPWLGTTRRTMYGLCLDMTYLATGIRFFFYIVKNSILGNESI